VGGGGHIARDGIRHLISSEKCRQNTRLRIVASPTRGLLNSASPENALPTTNSAILPVSQKSPIFLLSQVAESVGDFAGILESYRRSCGAS
jgi:hypothetical protein